MIYSDSNTHLNSLNEISRLLEHANYLTEQECIYRPEMVPIRENKRLQKDIIRLEDFVDYAISNGITEGGYALAQICEANGASQDNIVFSVDEVSVLEDTEMEDTVKELLNRGQQVYACPINSNDIAYILGEAVVETADKCLTENNEEYCDTLLEAYINDNFNILLSEEYILESIFSKIKDKAGALYDKAKTTASDIRNRISTSAKNAKNWTARKIATGRELLRKMGGHIADGAEYAKDKLYAAGNKIKSGAGYLKDKAIEFGKGTKQFVSDNYNKLKDKISKGMDYLSEKLKRKKVQESAELDGIAGNSYGKCDSSTGNCGKGFLDSAKNTVNKALYGSSQNSGNSGLGALRRGLSGNNGYDSGHGYKAYS